MSMSIDSMTDNRMAAATVPSAAQDRQAFIAALGFPVLVIIGGVIGYFAPNTAASFAPQVTPLLGIVMFGMGLTLPSSRWTFPWWPAGRFPCSSE